MGALNPGDMLKDHKDVLLPVAGALVLLLGLGYFYGQGGDWLGNSGNLVNPGNDDNSTTSTETKTYEAYPEMIIDEDEDYRATIKTNYGDITINLFAENAPRTVNNFVFLAEDDFYDGLTFHRIISDFVIQGGDPEGTGAGDPGYKFEDEINPRSLGLDQITVAEADFLSSLYDSRNASTSGYAPNSLREHSDRTLEDFYDDVIGYDYNYSLESVGFKPGVIAMANSGPDTNGSQFFITVSGSEVEYLNGRHTVFGEVIDGMDVVDTIASVNTGSSGKPVKEVEIEDVKIETL
jgi:peptidyl-prolyl cis-trans isomerase A (cyclophilin A)